MLCYVGDDLHLIFKFWGKLNSYTYVVFISNNCSSIPRNVNNFWFCCQKHSIGIQPMQVSAIIIL